MKICEHQEDERYELMTKVVNKTHDYSILPPADFIHECKICGNKCTEFFLWMEMKRLYD